MIDWPALRGIFGTDEGRRWGARRGAVDEGGTSCRYALVHLRDGRLRARAVVSVALPSDATPLRRHVFDQLEVLARKRSADAPIIAPPADARHEVLVDRYSGGGLYELEEKTTFQVIERASRVVLFEATGEGSASFTGGGAWGNHNSWGVWKVTLDADDEHVWIYQDERPRRTAIPGTAAHAADLAAHDGPPCPRCDGRATFCPAGGGRCVPCGLDWTDEPGAISTAC